jgi:uncharacterized protein (DUF169 family)
MKLPDALFSFRHAPVAIAFRDEAPPGLSRVARAGPSGCSYWRLAAEGHAFYTEAADHKACLVGAYTHNAPLSEAEGKELAGLVGTMAGARYLDPAEVASIPRREAPLRLALYAPLASAPFEPDLALFRASAREAMLLGEAAHAAGVPADAMPAMLRPTCAVIPQTLASGRAGASLACVGNRVYTGLEDGEMYVALPGARLAEIGAKLATILEANRALEHYHAGRRASLGAARVG